MPFSMPTGAATIVGLIIWAPVVLLMPEKDFLAIRELSYDSGMVTIDRAVRKPDTVASWTVTVFNSETGDGVCQGSGHSEYTLSEPTRQTFPLDYFVNDAGCLDRLTAGEYTAYAAWSPLDGREPVSKSFKLEIDP